MARIILQEKVIMLLKDWSFVMMLQGLPGLKWDGWVVFTTIEYGQNSEIYLGRDRYFDQNKYLIGDSEFSTSAVMNPAFKKIHNSNLSEEKRFFNTSLQRFASRVSTA